MTAAPLPEEDRRRLLEVRGLHPAVPVLVLHPLLTVVTGFGREASDTVVECLGRLGAPLGPTVTGSVEIGGRILDLPGALADPDARPEVVRSPMIVGELGRRRAANAALDLSQRAARVSRREAGLARRDQLVDRLDRLSNRADELERQLNTADHDDDRGIERLLAAARVPDPIEPNPIVTALIDEWEALVIERKASGSGPTAERAEANLEAIRARIAERRLAVADGKGDGVLSAKGVTRVQDRHAVVERLASTLEEGRRSERKAAGREVSAALDAEQEALTELGFESYAAFLLALAEGRAEEDGAHEAAALRTAEAALVRAQEREAAFVVLSERELDLRARVARLLGRLPGPDVGSELRAGRETITAPNGALDQLAAALRDAGAPVGDDPIASAERWLGAAEGRFAQHAALRAELAEIESEGSRLDEQLEAAEAELAVAERDLIAGVSGSLAGREAPLALDSVGPEELASVFAAVVAPEGPPVVVGECFADLSAQGCVAVLEVVSERSHRRQMILVTEHDAVGRWAQSLGIEAALWTPAEAEAANRALRTEAHRAENEVAEAPVEVETVEVETVEVVVEVEADSPVEVPAAAEVETSDVPVPDVIVLEPVPEPVAEPPVDAPAEKRGPALFDFDAVEAAAAEAGAVEARAVEVPEARAVEVPEAKPAPPPTPKAKIKAEPKPEPKINAEPKPEPKIKAEPKPEPKAKAEPKAEPKAKADAPATPPSSRAEGPWKAPRRVRRKRAATPPPAPWEGRFDTSRERELPGRPRTPIETPAGSDPLAVCARHRGVLTRKRCARCATPSCDECLVKPRGRRKPVCIECALIESGVRKRRSPNG